MKTLKPSFKLAAVLLLALGLFTGCESTDGGSSSVSGGVYYGVGLYDPWYYGGGYYPPDIIVTPPDRPPPGLPNLSRRPCHPLLHAP